MKTYRYPTFELNSFSLKNPFWVAIQQLGDFLEEICGSVSGNNMLWDGGSFYGVKSIRCKKNETCFVRYPLNSKVIPDANKC